MSQYNNGVTARTVAAANEILNTQRNNTTTASQIKSLARRQGGCRQPINGKLDTYNAVLADLDRVLAGYEQVLWLYAGGICRCNPDRFDYLINVELPFYLKPDVYADLELLVKHIVNESHLDLKVAA